MYSGSKCVAWSVEKLPDSDPRHSAPPEHHRPARFYRMNPSMGDVYRGSRRVNPSLTCASGEPKTVAFVVLRTCANSLRNPPLKCFPALPWLPNSDILL